MDEQKQFTRITITEALAEIKMIKAKVEKKSLGILPYLVRPSQMVDPLAKDGGSPQYVEREIQAIRDLNSRLVAIRRAIAKANMEHTITVGGVTRTIADWLVWKREIANEYARLLSNMSNTIHSKRSEASNRDVDNRARLIAIRQGIPLDDARERERAQSDVVVNISEKTLTQEIEDLQEITDTLDGQLSLRNATVMVEIEEG